MYQSVFLALELASSRVEGLVQHLVMQTVSDVLESQCRSALLPEALISKILSQLSVTIAYEPMNCQKVVVSLTETVESSIYSIHFEGFQVDT
ncbi:hypothetical protein KIN20_027543 [Parelaphostrongylus tenuis]|uniref:Uncharacterized protein n=1 Tax=Parelaphostrongylus tenuis TaxID=148309 RepID=A0AAD5QZL6_PARTN|nr:hypothetical protein KIN20_027543 [Parelaphostrongylus tenuis]